MTWCVYVLRCANGELYTGSTNDLAKRLAQHRAGRGGRYTRSHLPAEVVYQERFDTASEARKREAQVKSYPRKQKLALIANSPHPVRFP